MLHDFRRWLGLVCIAALVAAGCARAANADSSSSDARVPDRRFALVHTPAKSIRATFTLEIDTPRLTATSWTVFASQPPIHPNQSDIHAQLAPAGQSYVELSPLERTILRGLVHVDETSPWKQRIKIEAHYRARLHGRRLVEREAGRKYAVAPRPTREQLEPWLRTTPLMDFEAERFRSWLARHELRRRRGEGTVVFARRAFLTIKRHFEYEYTSKMDREASHVCEVGRSDCGGMSILFCSILRSQGIAARALAGRWAKSAKPGQVVGEVPYYQQHVKAEFFAPGVGWVPVDCSSGVLHDRSQEGLEYFGNDPGNFLVLHLDPELKVDSVIFGKHDLVWLQGANYWVRGRGTLDDTGRRENWVVDVQD